MFRQCINSEQYSTETLLKLAIHVWPTSNQKLVHIKKVLNKLINQNTRPKYLLVKWKLLSKNNPVYSNNNMGEKELPTQKLVKTHSKNDTQTIKDHSTSVDIKMI